MRCPKCRNEMYEYIRDEENVLLCEYDKCEWYGIIRKDMREKNE